ncbi:MAG: hypothetical protein ACTHK0_07480 [Ginsengibacter sp.]
MAFSGGTATVVAAPAFLVGAGTAVVGTIVTANASKNLSQGNGLIKSNSNGSSGRGSNNRKPDKENATGDHSVIDKNGIQHISKTLKIHQGLMK